MKHELPNTMFVKVADHEGHDPIFEANNVRYELAEPGYEIYVGRYELVEVAKVNLEISAKVVSTKKHAKARGR